MILPGAGLAGEDHSGGFTKMIKKLLGLFQDLLLFFHIRPIVPESFRGKAWSNHRVIEILIDPLLTPDGLSLRFFPTFPFPLFLSAL
jgi:hypothetical protein